MTKSFVIIFSPFKVIINISTGGQIEDYDEDGLKFDYIYEDVFVQYLARQNYTTLSKLGHQYNDFVFDCNYRGEDCR